MLFMVFKMEKVNIFLRQFYMLIHIYHNRKKEKREQERKIHHSADSDMIEWYLEGEGEIVSSVNVVRKQEKMANE